MNQALDAQVGEPLGVGERHLDLEADAPGAMVVAARAVFQVQRHHHRSGIGRHHHGEAAER